MEQEFGHSFNCIYIRGDEFGKVIGHFTLYNLIAWKIVLAEANGIPDSAAGLISNAQNNSIWSDRAADKYDVPFSWLDSATDGFDEQRYQARFEAQVRSHLEGERARLQTEIIQQVGQDLGLVAGQMLTLDNSRDFISQVSQRLTNHFMRLPVKDTISDKERAALYVKK